MNNGTRIQFLLLITIFALLLVLGGCNMTNSETDNVSGETENLSDTEYISDSEDEDTEEEKSPLAKILEEDEPEEEEPVVEEEEPEEEEEQVVEEEPEEEEEDESIPSKTFKEGEMVSFDNLEDEDADGDPITYTFSSPLDEDGEWQTDEGDAGEYIVTITASDGKTSVEQDVMIIIEPLNSAPVIDIDDITVDEGETIELEPEVSDPDGDGFEIEYSGWMTSASYTTTFNDAGTYDVTITATDEEGNTASEEITVTVREENRAPEMESISDITVTEGETVEIEPEAEDPDGDDVTITFSDPLDEDGTWETEEGDAGEYTVTIRASDGSLRTTQRVDITVEAANTAPELSISDVLVNVGETVELDPEVDDADGDDVEVTYSGWMTSKMKVADEAGEYEVTVTASDGMKETSKTITVTVNTPPEIDLGGLF